MKDGIGKLIFVLTIIIILLLFSSPYLFIELWNIQSGRSTIFELTINDIKDDIDSAINKDKYNKILNEYIKKRFGDSLSKKFEIIKNNGRSYKVKFNDIMDETFYIAYYKGKHSCSDNFEQVISNDKKFQHLYSEWVKKQVGIEDENVEFKFSKNTNVTINFDRIDKLSKDYKEVFENTKGMELIQIFQYNIRDLSRENWYEYASNYLKYYNKIKLICNFNVLCDYNGFLLYLYKYEQDKNNVRDREEYYGTFDKPNNIDTTIINGIIYEDKAEFEQFEDEKIKKYVIDKNGNIIK